MRFLAWLMMALIAASGASRADDEERLGIKVRMAWRVVIACGDHGCIQKRNIRFIRVLGVDKDSDAETKGVRADDFVDSINGTLLVGLSQEGLEACLIEMESREDVDIGLVRINGGTPERVRVRVKLKPKPQGDDAEATGIRS